MLNYYTLSKKPTFTLNSKAEGNTSVRCLDLLARKRRHVNLIDFELCKVTEYYVGRPDLISYVYYGTDIYGDVICKVNDISNPFEMNIGDVLVVPALFYCQEYIQNALLERPSELVTDNDSIISNETSRYKKLKNESRSPNELTINDSNYIIDRSQGLIFY